MNSTHLLRRVACRFGEHRMMNDSAAYIFAIEADRMITDVALANGLRYDPTLHTSFQTGKAYAPLSDPRP